MPIYGKVFIIFSVIIMEHREDGQNNRQEKKIHF